MIKKQTFTITLDSNISKGVTMEQIQEALAQYTSKLSGEKSLSGAKVSPFSTSSQTDDLREMVGITVND